MLVNSRFAKEHLEHLDENTKQVYLKHAIVIGLDFIDSKFGHNVDLEQLEQLTSNLISMYVVVGFEIFLPLLLLLFFFFFLISLLN
jgi:hypothetical protein